MVISIENDISSTISALEALGKSKKSATRKILSVVGTDAKNKAKKAYRASGLKKRTGALYKSINRKVGRSSVVISANARSDSNVLYGYALAKGGVIRAKGKGMKFSINGEWKTVKSIKRKSYDFIEKPVRDYLKSAELKARLDKTLEKETKRYLERACTPN